MQGSSLNLIALICLCVGPMIGSGLFALPQNLAHGGGILALSIAWLITLIGMYCLTKIFQGLANENSEESGCLYVYAKETLGDLAGFIVAWGYWISSWMGNIAYFVMLCATFNYFFPIFGEGITFNTLLASSAIIWGLVFLCSKGIKFSSKINTVGTLVKVVPILIFISFSLLKFQDRIFIYNFLNPSVNRPLLVQIREIMLVTAWVFVGIEGASIFSAQAKRSVDIGRATLLSFMVMSFIFLAISFLPFGLLNHDILANLNYPPLGELAMHLSGYLGGYIINIGLMIALLTGSLSWTLLSAEVAYLAATKDHLFPVSFQRENNLKVPIGALLITAICEQLYLIIAYWGKINYLVMINVAVTMMIPSYLCTAICYLQRNFKNHNSVGNWLISFLGILFSLWLLYAAGNYLLYSSILYLIGSICYLRYHRQLKISPLLTKKEKIFMIVLVLTACYSLLNICLGYF